MRDSDCKSFSVDWVLRLLWLLMFRKILRKKQVVIVCQINSLVNDENLLLIEICRLHTVFSRPSYRQNRGSRMSAIKGL
jgi:hypothetical protein